jgi:hypothetical protein
MPAPLRWLLWAAAAYLAYLALLFVFQRRLLYPTHLLTTASPDAALPEGFRRIWLQHDGGRTEAWFLSPRHQSPDSAAPVLICAHGNATTIDDLPGWLAPLHRHGLALLLVEYPGYGRSSGTPSQPSIAAAMRAAYDWLAGQPQIDPRRVIAFGISLGGGAVCQLASQRPVAALVLMSTFTGTRAFAASYLAPAVLIRDPFDNLAVLRTYAAPVLILHGRQDDIIPFAHAETLHRNAPQSRLIAYPCGHNDCPPDRDGFHQDLLAFLDHHGLRSQARR